MGSQIISNKIHSDGIFDIYKRRKVVFIPKNPLNLDWIVLSNSSITRHHCACWWHRFPFNSSTIISDIYELFVSYVRLMAASTSNSWSTIVPTCDYTSYDSSFFLIFFFFFFLQKRRRENCSNFDSLSVIRLLITATRSWTRTKQ